ncbi:MAG: hypothetical protein ACXACA_09050 [Candidatus Ranarchaeia archaeon]|jgi:hypothetical protein
MLKYVVGVAFVILMPVLSKADLNNLMWAHFPAERHIFLVNEKTGNFYISLKKKNVIFKGLQPIEVHLGPAHKAKYEFLIEQFALTKVIKLDESNYAFEGKRAGFYERKCYGKLRIRKTSPFFAEVVSFEMNEIGQRYKGVMNRYILPRTDGARALLEEFSSIFFGNYYAAMGDDSIVY